MQDFVRTLKQPRTIWFLATWLGVAVFVVYRLDLAVAQHRLSEGSAIAVMAGLAMAMMARTRQEFKRVA